MTLSDEQKKELVKQLDEKKAYLEKIKGEFFAVIGQVQLLENMLQNQQPVPPQEK